MVTSFHGGKKKESKGPQEFPERVPLFCRSICSVCGINKVYHILRKTRILVHVCMCVYLYAYDALKVRMLQDSK